MKFYDKFYADNYEELLSYYPKFYREVYEMKEILKAHGRLADDLEGGIEQTYRNAFVDYADEATIGKLESFLHIVPDAGSTVEDRRRIVKSYFVGFGKVSASMLRAMVSAYLQSDCDMELVPVDAQGNHALHIRIFQNGDITRMMVSFRKLFRRRIPAHIAYVFDQWISDELDETDVETARVPGIIFHMGMPFWTCFVFDGVLRFNGSVLFNQRRRYELAVRVTHGMKVFTQACEKVAVDSSCKMGIRLQEGCKASASIHAELAEPHEGNRTNVLIHMQIHGNTETAGGLSVVTKTRDYFFFDGSVTFDGSRSFNSVYEKEDFE